METSKSNSFFYDIRSRELNGFGVRKRPLDGMVHNFGKFGVVDILPNGEQTPPMAVSFCKTIKNCHIFAVSTENGYVSLFDSRRNLSSSVSYNESAEARITDWAAHQNAIFDVCWIKDDNYILTASGEQTIKVWDVQERKSTGVLKGHMGSVKSLSSHPSNSDLIVSGSRDGSFGTWDLRCKSNSNNREGCCILSTAMVNGAHLPPHARRSKRGKSASMSITSVLYLKDGVSIATAGAIDSIVKFWDTRNLRCPVTQTSPQLDPLTEKERRLHGISCLSQDSSGLFLTASCMDNRIYLYNVLQLDKGPMQSFTGCRTESFFVKSAISPDASYILSGSGEGNAYIWQVNKPKMDPTILSGHSNEVTAVDWCPSDYGKIATASDDFTVRLWKPKSGYCSNIKNPSSIRRRIMAIESTECRKLLKNEEADAVPKTPTKPSDGASSSSCPTTMPIVNTPEAYKTRNLFSSEFREISAETLEVESESPSSVLNPPSSLKRKTIRDYFLVSPGLT